MHLPVVGLMVSYISIFGSGKPSFKFPSPDGEDDYPSQSAVLCRKAQGSVRMCSASVAAKPYMHSHTSLSSHSGGVVEKGSYNFWM